MSDWFTGLLKPLSATNEQVFMAVQKAFDTLTDISKRRAYDSSLEFDDSIPGERKCGVVRYGTVLDILLLSFPSTAPGYVAMWSSFSSTTEWSLYFRGLLSNEGVLVHDWLFDLLCSMIGCR